MSKSGRVRKYEIKNMTVSLTSGDTLSRKSRPINTFNQIQLQQAGSADEIVNTYAVYYRYANGSVLFCCRNIDGVPVKVWKDSSDVLPMKCIKLPHGKYKTFADIIRTVLRPSVLFINDGEYLSPLDELETVVKVYNRPLTDQLHYIATCAKKKRSDILD